MTNQILLQNDVVKKKIDITNPQFVLRVLKVALAQHFDKMELAAKKVVNPPKPMKLAMEHTKNNYVDLTGMSSDEDKSDEEDIGLIERYMQYLESKHGLLVIDVEQVKNKTSVGMQKAFIAEHNLEKQEKVLLLHGTLAENAGKMKHTGMESIYNVRCGYGPGSYFSDKLSVALQYGLEDEEGMMTIFVVECVLGKTKDIGSDRSDYDFVSKQSKEMCHTKIHRELNYYILRSDNQTNIIAMIRLKKANFSKKSNQVQLPLVQNPLIIAARQKARQQREEEAHAKSVKRHKTATQKAIDMANWMKNIDEHRKPVEDKDLDIGETDGIKYGDIVYLSKVQSDLNSKQAVVRSMLRDKGFLMILVEMCRTEYDKDIIRINELKELKNQHTGHTRYGDVMKKHYLACGWNQISNKEKDKTKIKIFDVPRR